MTDIGKENLKAVMGLTNSWTSGVTVNVMEEKIILNAWKWFGELLKADPKLSAGTYVLIQVMQPVGHSTFESMERSSAVAYTLPGSIPFDQVEFRLCLAAYAKLPRTAARHRRNTWILIVRCIGPESSGGRSMADKICPLSC